jgi:GxxExxY protein
MKEINGITRKEFGVEERRTPSRAERLGAVQDPLTYEIIGAAQKVHRTLGPGFTEATYENALSLELVSRKIPFVRQPNYDVLYEGKHCGTYNPDIVIRDKVVVELKAVSAFGKEHVAQAISYLRASGHPVALLLNFGAPSLEFRRFEKTPKKIPKSQKS